jgi:hypothetical protein
VTEQNEPKVSRRRENSTQRVPHPRNGNGKPDVAALLEQNRLLEEQNRLLQQQVGADPIGPVARFIETQADPTATGRVADEEELTDFQRELRSDTRPTPQDYKRHERNYNYPKRWFAKPDGMIVQLQGDPQNRTYYIDKGFRELSPEEVERYLKRERLTILKVQQKKASIINNLRRVIALDPTLRAGLDPKFDDDTDKMTIPELEMAWRELTHDENGKKRFTLQRPQRLQDADDLAAQRESDRMLEGVEMTPTPDVVAEFEARQEQAQSRRRGRTVEVTPSNYNQFR